MRLSYPMRELIRWTRWLVVTTAVCVVMPPLAAVLTAVGDLAWRER